ADDLRPDARLLPGPGSVRPGAGPGRTGEPFLDAGSAGSGVFGVVSPVIPGRRTLGVLDAEPFQLGRQRPCGGVDRDDADLDPFVQGRVDPRELDPSASVAAGPGRERPASAPELEEEGTVF